MTPDAAEKAGVPVAWLYPFGGKMVVTMDRQVACDAFPGVANPVPLVPASALDTARAEIERLNAELVLERGRSRGDWANQRLVDAAILDAAAAQERIAELEGGFARTVSSALALTSLLNPTMLPAGAEQQLEATTEQLHRARATLSPAVKEPK